jgi:DNA-binding NarL/FixJ family response regulator
MSVQPKRIWLINDNGEQMESILCAFGYDVMKQSPTGWNLSEFQSALNKVDGVVMNLSQMTPHLLQSYQNLRHLSRHSPIATVWICTEESVWTLEPPTHEGLEIVLVKPLQIPVLMESLAKLLQRQQSIPRLESPHWSPTSGVMGFQQGWQPQNRSLESLGRPYPSSQHSYGYQPPHLMDIQKPNQPLTHREMEILSLLAQGLSNRQIAENLVLSELTVKTHLKNMFKKMNVKSRTQAIALGMRYQLIYH